MGILTRIGDFFSGGPSVHSVPARPRASLDGSAPQWFPYDASNWASTEMGDWLPWIRSPDTEIDVYRDRMVARARDLYRNDSWANGSISHILDSTIGARYRLCAIPDIRALELHTRAFDEVWAEEFRRTTEALWRSYADDHGRYNDLARELTVAGQFRQALGHKLVDGESLAVCYWLPERVGRGAASYATCWQVVDPDRLSNWNQMVDTKHLRNGVEIDDNGVPKAYHIRKAHQNDWYNSVESMQWERVEREEEDGWRRVIHDYDRLRAGQHRGISVFTPVLMRMKMLARYYGVELQAATVNSIFGVYVKSPYDPSLVQDSMDGGAGELSAYQKMRADRQREKGPTMLNKVQIPVLAPGEDIVPIDSKRPNSQFSPFTQEMLRSFSAVLGVTSEQVTRDYSKTNFSSIRAAIVEAEKTFNRRVHEFNSGFADPYYANWLQEAMDRGDLPLPLNAPDFVDARNAYARCRWLGPARGWADPVGDRQGAILGLDAGFETLEQQCARQGGDWEEHVAQRAREVKRFKESGLNLPEWAGGDMSATKASTPPEKTVAE